jgi:hypothetical protein
MALTWNIAELIARWRTLTGLSSTADLSDAAVTDLINDYYVNHFPTDGAINEFDTFLTQALSATDDGEYSIDDGVDRLDDPVTINGDPILLARDRERFFNEYPADEQYVTAPTLAIGASDTAAILNAAFTYRISGYTYSKASAETSFSGLNTVPQNKYGAFSLKIDEDGTVTIAEATSNSTGYDTPRLALEGLTGADGDSCYMGYVTAISTASAGFIPGTTALDTGTLTVTYTDGRFDIRNEPEAALLYGTKLYIRPKPNDIYEFRALQVAQRPTALSGSTTIADPKHGPMIAAGAAMLYLNSVKDFDGAKEIAVQFKYYQRAVKQDKIKRLLGQPIKRSF